MPLSPVSGGGGSGQFSSICDSLLTVAAATFDTNTILGGNIPGSYKHLQIWAYLREDDAGSLTDVGTIRFNNDSGANYDYSRMNLGAVAVSTNGGLFGVTGGVPAMLVPGGAFTAGHFATFEANINNYAATTGQKLFDSLAVMMDTSAANSLIRSHYGAWRNTAAITRIQLIPGTGNWLAGSRFTLYGLS